MQQLKALGRKVHILEVDSRGLAARAVEARDKTERDRVATNGENDRNVDLTAKRFELLHELVPKGARFAALVNSNYPSIDVILRDLQTGAEALGLEVEILYAGNDREIDAAFAKLSQRPDSVLGSIPT